MYKNMYKEGNIIPILIDVLTVAFCCFSFFELKYQFYEYVKLFLFIFWLMLISITNLRPIIKNKFLIFLVLYFFCCLIYAMATRGIIFGFKYSLLIILAEAPLLMFMYYVMDVKNNMKSIKRLITIVLIVICFLCLNMLRLLSIDPNAARIMASSKNIYENELCGGGYGLAYALCLLTPYLIINIKHYKRKFLMFLIVILYTYTLIKCSYTIAILIFAFELFFLACLDAKSIEKNKGFALICFCFCLILLFVFKSQIGNFLIQDVSKLFSGSFVETRMKELGGYLIGEVDDLSRFELFRKSMDTFVHYPLIGVSYFTKFNKELEVFYNGIWYVGNHSDISDGLARVGLIYFLYISFLFFSIKYIFKTNKSKKCIAIYVALIVILSINTGTFGAKCVALLIVPLLELIETKKNLKSGELFEQKKCIDN